MHPTGLLLADNPFTINKKYTDLLKYSHIDIAVNFWGDS